MKPNRREIPYLWKTALLSFVTAALALLPAVILGGGQLMLTDDFSWQQQIFNLSNVSLWRSGGLFGWDWFADLGSSAANSFAFYNLFSPYTLLLLPFPGKAIPYLTAPLLVLKLTVSGVGGALYCRKFVKRSDSAVLGGLLYAFSGAQAVNLLFPFADAISLFPFVLYALEELVSERRTGLFALTLAIAALTNFYLFFGEIIFVILYYLFRTGDRIRQPRQYFRTLGRFAWEGIAGTLASCFVLLPALLSVAGNPRVSALETSPLFSWQQYLTIFQAYFLPPDVMGYGNALFQKGCDSCALWLPFVGMSLVFAELCEGKKKRFSCFLLLLALISLQPILNSVFSLLNGKYYARWFFMPALVFAMASAGALDRAGERSLSRGGVFNFLCTAMTGFLAAAAYVYYRIRGVESMTEKMNFPLILGYSLAGSLCALGAFLILRDRNAARRGKCLLAGVLCLAVLGTGAAAFRYSVGNHTRAFYEEDVLNTEGRFDRTRTKEILAGLEELKKLLPEGDNYRIRTDWHEMGPAYQAYSYDNLSLLWQVPSVNSFLSTLDGSVFDFYHTLGADRGVSTAGDFCPERMALLSVKYYLTEDPSGGPAGGKTIGSWVHGDGTEIFLCEYPEFLPMGFTYGSYLTPEEIPEEWTTRERAGTLRESLVLTAEAAEELKTRGILLSHGEGTGDKRVFAESFTRGSRGFSCELQAKEGQLLYFSVPYSGGWRAEVNGASVQVLETGGMMAIPVTEGTNRVSFTYREPGLTAGAILSLAGILAIALEKLTFSRKRGKINS